MKDKVISIVFESEGSIGFDGSWLYISREVAHHSFEELRQHAMAFYKSGTNGYAAIALASVTGIEYHQRETGFFIRYKPTKGKATKYYLRIKDPNERDAFCKSLAQASRLVSRTEKPSPFAGFWMNLVLLIFSGAITWAFISVADSGEYQSRRALVHLAAQLAQWIGPGTCLAIGSLFCLFYLFRIFRNIFNPRKTIKYHTS